MSNDQLYGSDPKFINEINEISTGIVEELLTMLKSLADKPKVQSAIALELFQRVTTKADLLDDQIAQLALNLWNLSLKNRNQLDTKLHLRVLNHLECVSGSLRKHVYRQRIEELINRMKSKL